MGGRTQIPEVEDLAVDILGFLAANQERLVRFLDLTGLDPGTLRRAAAAPGFAASLFDYLCADDRLLLAFAAEAGHDPQAIEALRQRLETPDVGTS